MTLDRNTLLEAAKMLDDGADIFSCCQANCRVADKLRALAAAQPEGWVLVPREPTGAILDALWQGYESQVPGTKNPTARECAYNAYRAMLAAAGGKS